MVDESSVITKTSFLRIIMTLGIVYGDIGTSPLYVMSAIISSAGRIDEYFILGALSCIIWTLALLTSFKYVAIALRADNKGEGGIFSLFALIRKYAPWIYIIAIIGGAAILADGVITPSITIVSATEGLLLLNKNIPVVPISLLIIFLLFSVQKFGTKVIGNSFGPIMFFWFALLGSVGLVFIIKAPFVLKSFNPYYAYHFLTSYHGGFILLGAVFLATTGAEALYSDLGHCGKKNIRISWVYVKTMLIINYLGQGAWLMLNVNNINSHTNPFFAMMPGWLLVPAIIIATMAAIIASQALISGAYTLITVAMSLDLWPHLKIKYPTNIRGQMYISSVNWALFIACFFVVIFFKESANMTAAYGLSITITMLMTTLLLTYYLHKIRKVNIFFVVLFMMIFLTIEGGFLVANLHKFMNGGWFTILLSSLLFMIMYIWNKGKDIKKRFVTWTRISPYYEIIKDIKQDITIPKYATNLVYFTKSEHAGEIETKIIFSIVNKHPKRADIYWLIHINTLDEPNTKEYKITTLIPETLMRIDFYLGFRIQPRINLFLKQVIDELIKNNEIDLLSRYPTLRKHHVLGDFSFIIIDRIQNWDFDFSTFEQFLMNVYFFLKKIGISEVHAYGLDTSNIIVEEVPLININNPRYNLKRTNILNSSPLK